MQQPSPVQPSPVASSFAGFLATLTAPKTAAAEDETLWSSSDLGEDVASLTYERALRTHARYRYSNNNGAAAASSNAIPGSFASGTSGSLQTNAEWAATTDAAADRDLRSASVTIRLSKAECARLRNRATEAGLTVSAYLRSCALEADALRAEVKKTLAELKAGTEAAGKTGTAASKEKEAKQRGLRGSEGVRLTRILGHIGKFWMGLASDRPA